MGTSKRSPAVTLTEARVRLFRLVEELLAGRTDRVALSHRGHDEQVVLMRAGDVARMEAELATLRRRSIVSEPRPLWGIATVVGEVEDIVADIRAEANRQREKRMREFFDDEPVSEASAEPEAPRTGTRRRGSRPRKSTP